jgi:hypothetical protein
MPTTQEANQRRFAGAKGQFTHCGQVFDRFLADEVMAIALYNVTHIMEKSRSPEEVLFG